MKSMMLTGIRKMEMKEVPEPQVVNPHDVKIRMKVAGVCGSDIHYYTHGRIGSQVVEYPFPVGHECAGTVIETGSGVTRVKPGDMVAIEPAMPCGECDQCLSGRPNTCRKLVFLGCPGQAEGCLKEFIVMPDSSCFRLKKNTNADQGAISEPLAIGVYSVVRAPSPLGRKIGILGFGPIGMSVFLAAKAGGAEKIYVTDKIPERLKIAQSEGADADFNPLHQNVEKEILGVENQGLDIVFECCGQQDAFDQGLNILKPGGTLMVVGIPELDRWSMGVDLTRRRELTVRFVRRQAECTEAALSMMEENIIDVGRMVTHRFAFENTKEAFDLVAAYAGGVMKAMIDF
ncbi:MAG TPA: alcohol dehydrogenase catalytic domain-containing protein [Bacteroidales bacterium]|nr:alcohol dehydrogenase catalytic domain-containing protein [Bacteroidales bacterium]